MPVTRSQIKSKDKKEISFKDLNKSLDDSIGADKTVANEKTKKR